MTTKPAQNGGAKTNGSAKTNGGAKTNGVTTNGRGDVEVEIDLSGGITFSKGDAKDEGDKNKLSSSSSSSSLLSSSWKAGSTYLIEDKYRVTALPSVEKGDNDWRDYRAFVLDNGLQGLVVQDVHSKATAMAASVHVGASADPRSLSGLAHFCEHMVFLGSSKYPEENGYKQHVSQHGGRSNASTSMRFTTYKFDVTTAASPEAVERAVDMFAHFFLDPLFTESGTAREVAAVDSENSKNVVNDARRRLQIFKNEANPKHHYSKFSTGNAATLQMPWAAKEANDKDAQPTEEQLASAAHVRRALLAFHRFHYRPDNMSVVLVGPQSLDTLQQWLVTRFATMKSSWPTEEEAEEEDDDGQEQEEDDNFHDAKDDNHQEDFHDAEEDEEQVELRRLIARSAADAPLHARFGQPPPRFHAAFPPKDGEAWPILLSILPLKQVRKLSLSFPLPAIAETDVDRSPTSLLSHILGHEGAGSAFAALQNRGWITALSAGNRIQQPDQTVFQLDVSLTPQGEDEWQAVAALLFEQCRLLHESVLSFAKNPKDHPLVHAWEEMALLSKLKFHQTSPGSAYDAAPSLSQTLLMYGAAKCKSAGFHLDEKRTPDPALLQDFSSRLVPSNCMVERSSQAAWDAAESGKEAKRCTEPWYGIEYYKQSLQSDAALLQLWTTPQTNNKKELHLPLPNRFLPRSLELCADLPPEAHKPRIEQVMESPELLVDTTTCDETDKLPGRLWHRLDDRYALPKASISLLIRNPLVEHATVGDEWKFDATNSILSSLLMSVFGDAMAQETYDAELANLHWSLSKSSWGLTLSCFGYSDRLADLALAVLQDFTNVEIFWQRYGSSPFFEASRDKLVRSLQSFLKSQRADAHALYYRDLLVSSEGGGIADSLAAAQAATLQQVQRHHATLVTCRKSPMDCLYMGNVGKDDAKAFFQQVCHVWSNGAEAAAAAVDHDTGATTVVPSWIPGPLERVFPATQDVELHFASQNPEEENGAIVVTYQSPIPSYRGDELDNVPSSSSLSASTRLTSTAAIRLLCHMLREPLFDELRTKQQLGYIVTSYYDVGYSRSRSSSSSETSSSSSQMDFLVVDIVSRRASPPQVLERLDVFLRHFGDLLERLPLGHYQDALAVKLRKPLQKLDSEVSLQFGNLRRFGASANWTRSERLATAVEQLTREDLRQAWNRLVADNTRVVSCVYGNTFPLTRDAAASTKTATTSSFMSTWSWGRLAPWRFKSVAEIVERRPGLALFDDAAAAAHSLRRRRRQVSQRIYGTAAAVAAVVATATLGGYYLGWFGSSSGKSKSRGK